MITINKILIGVDNSTFADHAAKVGFGMARKFKAQVGLVHIIEPAVIPSAMNNDTMLGTSLQTGVDVNSLELIDVQNEMSDNVIIATAKKYGEGVKVSRFTDYGSTADGIINCGKRFGADMIVLGTHSRSGIDRFFMGSIAEEVVRNSAIPVLVVPSEEKR